jgi:hypothetical protein
MIELDGIMGKMKSFLPMRACLRQYGEQWRSYLGQPGKSFLLLYIFLYIFEIIM